MATREADLFDVPSIADLLWDADRRSLHEFDGETRQLLEEIGEAVWKAWPSYDEEIAGLADDDDGLVDHKDWKPFTDELAKIGVDLSGCDGEEGDSVVDAVKKTIESAR